MRERLQPIVALLERIWQFIVHLWFTYIVPLAPIQTMLQRLRIPPVAALWIAALLKIVFILVFVLVTVLFLVWLERKYAGRIQRRLGPMRVGRPHGWAQTVADALKLFFKEDVIPAAADRWVFTLAPIIVFVPVVMIYVVVPFSRDWAAANLNIGLLYVLAVSSIGVLAVMMGGWSANNKYTLLGALRAASQMISYEVPMVLSLVAVMLLAGMGTGEPRMDLQGIVESQRGPQAWCWSPFSWLILRMPLGPLVFLVFIIATMAEVNRVPFDLPEAESELVAGFHTEYSGMKFAWFFLGEYGHMFAMCAIGATVFLGGWLGPGPAFLGVLWFLIKSYALVLFVMWVRWTLPRVRVDQLTALAWKVLLPCSLALVLIAAALALVRLP